MELQAASLAQIQAAKSGEMVLIEEDVGSVVGQIQEVDSSFRVRYSEVGEYFVVYAADETGHEYLVTTAQELDGRLLDRVRQIASERYDYAAQVESIDAAYEASKDHELREAVGEIGQRLAHALRQDRGLNQGRISVPRNAA